MHHGEGGEFVAEQLFVQQRPIAFDIAGLFQRPHAPQAGGRRDADPSRQLHVGDSPLILQLLEDMSVDGVEMCGHAGLLMWPSSIPPNVPARNIVARTVQLYSAAAATMRLGRLALHTLHSSREALNCPWQLLSLSGAQQSSGTGTFFHGRNQPRQSGDHWLRS